MKKTAIFAFLLAILASVVNSYQATPFVTCYESDFCDTVYRDTASEAIFRAAVADKPQVDDTPNREVYRGIRRAVDSTIRAHAPLALYKGLEPIWANVGPISDTAVAAWLRGDDLSELARCAR